MGKRIDFAHALNILLIQFLYCVGLILLMTVYGMLSGSALERRPYTFWDGIASGIFVFMLLGATSIFNTRKFYQLKSRGQITKGCSHLLVQAFFLLAIGILYVLVVCKLI